VPLPRKFCISYIKMVSFYAFPVIFIDTVTFKKGTLIKRADVRTPWTSPGSAVHSSATICVPVNVSDLVQGQHPEIWGGIKVV